MARALEGTGWATSGKRLLRPYNSGRYGWTFKGEAGLSERSGDVEGKDMTAVEIRTFQLQTLTGLNRLLSAAHDLGAALKCYQIEERHTYYGKPLVIDDKRAALAECWRQFAHNAEETFSSFQLANPSKIWDVPSARAKAYFEDNTSDFLIWPSCLMMLKLTRTVRDLYSPRLFINSL